MPHKKAQWLLPEGIEELLPPQAQQFELLRREILDHFSCWGYDLVMTPFIEYLDSLSILETSDLLSNTFRLNDQHGEKTMGIRADMTPQIARVDTRYRQNDAPMRLCYLGTVLFAEANNSGSRSALQLGAELFGDASIESDVEIIQLMLNTLQLTGISEIHLDLSHIAIFRALAKEAELSKSQTETLFKLYQRKDIPGLAQVLKTYPLANKYHQRFNQLISLYGSTDVLNKARQIFQETNQQISAALDTIEAIIEIISISHPNVEIYIDLSECQGYQFHTGVVFSAFTPGHGQEIARGGRYDHIGKNFGDARQATGFSADLKTLVNIGNKINKNNIDAIFAPKSDDPTLLVKINSLRKSGVRVIQQLSQMPYDEQANNCNKKLILIDNQWQIMDI